MSLIRTIGSVWLTRRFPVLAIAGMIYGMYKHHKMAQVPVRTR